MKNALEKSRYHMCGSINSIKLNENQPCSYDKTREGCWVEGDEKSSMWWGLGFKFPCPQAFR